ncbi:hypothetical protein OAL09_00400 [Verrucomicrobia bacterium]|nr:hypothetical protein [Verrucomicrobiales bacterium]MDC0047782.1 hypothetical protein [Verrucomicrobiota bacterium]
MRTQLFGIWTNDFKIRLPCPEAGAVGTSMHVLVNWPRNLLISIILV